MRCAALSVHALFPRLCIAGQCPMSSVWLTHWFAVRARLPGWPEVKRDPLDVRVLRYLHGMRHGLAVAIHRALEVPHAVANPVGQLAGLWAGDGGGSKR